MIQKWKTEAFVLIGGRHLEYNYCDPKRHEGEPGTKLFIFKINLYSQVLGIIEYFARESVRRDIADGEREKSRHSTSCL
jgi:hypothetical protein